MHKLQKLFAVILNIGLCCQPINVAAQMNIRFPPCTVDAFRWTFNNENQSPCEVAAILQGLCFNDQWSMNPLSPNSRTGYAGALQNQSNACQCSTVVFSLTAACGACQGGPVLSWSLWKLNCSESDVTISGYPLEIPPNTGVPAWAYVNVTATGNIWDQNAARSIAMSGAPETTGGSLPATAKSPPSEQTGSPNSTTSHDAARSPSKAAPIAGGVVGGVVALAALALACFTLYRRSRRPTRRQASLRMNEKVHFLGTEQAIGHARSLSDPLKLYDPSDPSTFPPSPSQTLPLYPGPLSPQSNQHGPDFPQPLKYQGMPEV